jgi:hypothetical protein
MNDLDPCVVCGTARPAIRAGIEEWCCSMSCYRSFHCLSHDPLDEIDTRELADLLDFTADALSWREGTVIYPDIQAHLRRWARRLGPNPREAPAQ